MIEKAKQNALIVDDEPDIRELLELTLGRMGVSCTGVGTVREAEASLERGTFDLCLADMHLPDGSGIDLVRHIQRVRPEVPVAVITAHGHMNAAIEALKAGAFDFVNKPVDLGTLRDLVSTALRLSQSQTARELSPEKQLLGQSSVMRQVRATIAKLARSQAPVLITGESGTGKELVARLIHQLGARSEGPFVPVNCGAIPEELIESELFGHCRGSFTGATADKEGLFQAADGGTLFLDEVADLPLQMQVKLLRAIQEKAIRPVGAPHEKRVDIRILSATHKDLTHLVNVGEFREDLFYRINVIELRVPSLNERPEDIPELADHILDDISAKSGAERPELTDEALEALGSYRFPGNVRELENILERAVALNEGQKITASDLGLPNAARAPASPLPDNETLDLESYLYQIEKDLILGALEQAENNKTAAARRLGITFRSLRYRLKKLGLE